MCTANLNRSAMAEAFLRAELARRATPTAMTVRSAGTMPRPSEPANPATVAAVADHGLDLSSHRSRTVTAADVDQADLVATMERAHVRQIVVLAPGALAKTFALKDLLRRGERVGGRRPCEPLADWLARLGADRDPAALLEDAPADTVADPQGRPAAYFRRAAAELRHLTCDLADLLLRPAGRPSAPPR